MYLDLSAEGEKVCVGVGGTPRAEQEEEGENIEELLHDTSKPRGGGGSGGGGGEARKLTVK